MEISKPCPCGAFPARLHVTGGKKPKWAYVGGDCCGEWEIEFRNDYNEIDSEQSMNLAVEAWNNAPRGDSAEKEMA